MTEQILLNKNKSKTSTNYNNSLAIQLKGSKRILPCDPMETTINEIDVYNQERENCSKIRLTVEINPICTNVLFNNITEIVKNEGDNENVLWLNYGKDCKDDLNELVDESLFFKTANDFHSNDNGNENVKNAIKDTQLSSSDNNYKYHCGIDIFNNHLLRSKTFKTVCPCKDSSSIPKENNVSLFNTIADEMRSYNGDEIGHYIDENDADKEPNTPSHLYLNEEVQSYKEAVSDKLIEQNGWFGFTNIGKLKVYDDKNNKNYDWFKVINHRKPCDFIDMYPERDLFFFDPKYNNVQRRIEKNWHYCITYPSSSTTNIPFIKTYTNKTTGLKAMFFDDTIKYKNGIDAIKIWSVSKHGLQKDDIINLYRGDDIVILNGKVLAVEDDYTFYIFRNGVKISNEWYEIPTKIVDDKITVYDKDNATIASFSVSQDRTYLYNGTNGYNKDKYYIINYKKVNIDNNAQDVSFKRVVNGSEVSYYVRIFSKLPNWKFKKEKPTEMLLEKFPNKIKEYQTTSNDFENHIGKLAFSKNIYNDNIAEIVFTDDIDFSVLKDNLGRPLSELYLTIIKNNAGYREWYGKNKDIDIKNTIVEYSHCFGKISSAFKLSKESIPNKDYNNVTLINNVENTIDRNGMYMIDINDGTRTNIEDDEIQYEPYNEYSGDSNFYGDLCCYSDVLCDEQSIQMIDFRFNTAQRELTNNFKAYQFIKDIYHDEITSDDYDDNNFKCKEYTIPNVAIRKEGYYYKPHYQIPIKSFDSELTTVYPRFLKIKTITAVANGEYLITTMENHLLGKNDIVNIYYKEPTNETYSNGKQKFKNHFYYGKVKEIKEGNSKSFVIILYSDNLMETIVNIDVNNRKFMKLFIKSEDIPSYATLLKDGSCRYVYRKLFQNGTYENSPIETYPFTNGSLYINKSFNFFLRRQNPYGENDLRSKSYPYDIVNSTISFEKENKYYNELEIEC